MDINSNAQPPRPGALIGAIDAGSNAIRFSVYKLDRLLYPLRVHQQRYPVRLGAGTFTTGALAEPDMDTAIEAFRDIAAMATQKSVTITLAVATSAIREASNSAAFLQRVRDETGIDLRTITGDEEARLAALGAASTAAATGNRLVLDVGGGSSEVISVVPDGTLNWNFSLPLGAVRLAQAWAVDGLATSTETLPQRQQSLTAAPELQPLRAKTITSSGTTAIAVGGTAFALYNACRHLGHQPDDNCLSLLDITRAMEIMANTPRANWPEKLGVDLDRAEILLPGTLILTTILRLLNLTDLTISDAGIREGLVQDYLLRARGPSSDSATGSA